jgi:uncharacterized protein YbjT (DUF2867 family)
MATVWVSGATGFVGQGLVKALIEAGHSVRALAHRTHVPESSPRQGVTIVRGDVLNPATLASSMEECDAAIHLVGIIAERRRASFYQVHYLGAVNAVEAALASGIRRFLLMSALGVRPDAASRYHQTKWMAERYLASSGMDYTIMRPSVIFGKNGGLINLLARMVRLSPITPVPGPGRGKMQPIWQEDVSACFVRALAESRAVGKIYELGGPKQYTYNELLETLAKLLGRKSRRLHIPLSLLRPLATAMEVFVPKPPLTRDQLIMLAEPNVCDITPMVDELGVRPAALEDVFLTYYGK